MDQSLYQEAIQKLEFFISCRSLADVDTFSKSDPFCKLFVKKNKSWTEYGKTELIWNNLNPNFAKSFIIDYYFEVQQHIKFEVHHYQSEKQSYLIGSCETTVGAIAGSKDQVLVEDLKNQNNQTTGKIIVRVDQVKSCNDDIKMKLGCTNVVDTRFWFWHTTSPFLRFYRLRKDDPHPVLVYETEHIDNNRNPIWKIIEVKSQKLCNGDYNMPIKVELWDYRANGSHQFIGQTEFSVEEVRQNSKLNRNIIDKKQNKVQATLNFLDVYNIIVNQFKQFQLIPKSTFMDYILGGLQLNLIVSIDFTASNKNPNDPSSLHYRDPSGKYNQYQQAIVAVGEILINYDYDKQVPVYGFGCKPKLPGILMGQTLHCFPLNGNAENPEVENLEGIMQVYQQALGNVIFDGPTYFAPTLQESMKVAQMCLQQSLDNYFILLILTDGEIHDFQASFDAIVASSHLPLSIIIVGIGNADFMNMEKLDNDDLQIVDSKGRKAKRDLVQFVPFNEFKNNPELLAKAVLEELPDQLVNYMELVKQKPKPPHAVNLNNFGLEGMKNSLRSQQQHQQNPPQQGYYEQKNYQQQQGGYQQYFNNQYEEQKFGIQALGQGMARGGFLKPFIQQVQNQNLTDQDQQQMMSISSQKNQSNNNYLQQKKI